MGKSSTGDSSLAVLILILSAALNEGHFVVPPHDVAPVRLVVFLKLGVELKVLSDTHDDVIGRNTWVGLITALIPLALAEVEGTDTKSNIDDGTLFGSLVLDLDTSKLSIFVSWQKKDAALGELL